MWNSNAFDQNELFDELFTKPIIYRLRKNLEFASDEKLKEIVESYESVHWHIRIARQVFFHGHAFYETNLEYICAKDILRGSFSWPELELKKNYKT